MPVSKNKPQPLKDSPKVLKSHMQGSKNHSQSAAEPEENFLSQGPARGRISSLTHSRSFASPARTHERIEIEVEIEIDYPV